MFCTNCKTEFTGNYCPNCGKNYSTSTHEYYDKDGDLIDLAVVRGVYRTPKKLHLFFERCTTYSASEIDEIIDYIRNNVTPKKYGIAEASRMQKQIESTLPRSKRLVTPMQRLLSGLFGLAAIAVVLVLCMHFLFGSPTSGEYISLEQFNAIENGMSYDAVVEILGSEGELLSSVDLGFGDGGTQMYCWYGDPLSGANCNVTFQGGKVVSKAQIGLD